MSETNSSNNSDTSVKENEETTQDTNGTAEVVPMDPKTLEAVRKRMAQDERLDSARNDFRNTLEDCDHFNDLGVFYAAGSPLMNSLGAELGIKTKDESGAISRTGIGFYIRCDHWTMAFAPAPKGVVAAI